MPAPTPASASLTYDCPVRKSGIHRVTIANEPRLVSERGPLGDIHFFRWRCEACGEMHRAELGDVFR